MKAWKMSGQHYIHFLFQKLYLLGSNINDFIALP